MVKNLFNELTKQIPDIGDYVMSYRNSIGIIMGMHRDCEDVDKYGRVKYFKVYFFDDSGYYGHSCETYTDDFETITPYLANILKSIDSDVSQYLFDLVYYKFHMHESYNDKQELYMKYVEDYINGVPTNVVKLLNFKSGIKKIIEHKHNSNVRIIEFNNNQIWEVKRKKLTRTANRRNIINYNSDKNTHKKIKSVRYTLLKRLK